MIRDLRFDEIERADRRRRLVRLVVGCLLVSTAATYLVSRESKIREEQLALPQAQLGDLSSLKVRYEAIESMLAEHHIWTGAFSARKELDALVVSIHSQETVMAKQEARKADAERRDREEVETARLLGYALVERRDYSGALANLQRALTSADSLGDAAYDGGPWEHRDKVLLDIHEIQALLAEGDAR